MQLRIEPAPRLTAFGPGWAAICGAVASVGLTWSFEALSVLVGAVVLVDPVVQSVWAALEALVSAGRRQAASLPYEKHRRSGLQPDAVHAELRRQAASLPYEAHSRRSGLHPDAAFEEPGRQATSLPYVDVWRRWQKTIWPVLLVLMAGPPLALALALRLGRGAPLMVAVSAVLVLVSLVMFGPDSTIGRLARAGGEIGLGWAIGYAVLSATVWSPPPDATVPEVISTWWNIYAAPATVGAFFVLSHAAWLALPAGASTGRIRWLNVGQVGVVITLVVLRQPLAAAGVALAVVGQALFQPWIATLGPTWYVRRTQWFLMAGMLMAALGISSKV